MTPLKTMKANNGFIWGWGSSVFQPSCFCSILWNLTSVLSGFTLSGFFLGPAILEQWAPHASYRQSTAIGLRWASHHWTDQERHWATTCPHDTEGIRVDAEKVVLDFVTFKAHRLQRQSPVKPAELRQIRKTRSKPLVSCNCCLSRSGWSSSSQGALVERPQLGMGLQQHVLCVYSSFFSVGQKGTPKQSLWEHISTSNSCFFAPYLSVCVCVCVRKHARMCLIFWWQLKCLILEPLSV